MGYEQRGREINTTALRADYENRVGPIQDFGIHAGGCPACGFDQQKVIYCQGARKLLDQPPDACPIENEHLHVLCARCQWEHLTKLRSDPSNPLVLPGVGALMDNYARAVLAAWLEQFGEIAPIGEQRVREHQEKATRVFVAMRDGSLSLSLLPPQEGPPP